MFNVFQNPQKKLIRAIREGKSGVVATLLAEGTSPDARDRRGDSALVLAYQSEHREIFQMLQKKGATLSESLSQAILMKELHRGRSELVEWLLGQGADVNRPNKVGSTPLLLASLYGLKSVVVLLLARGADVHQKDEDGTTCLLAAAAKGHLEIVKLLVAAGADVKAANTAKMTPLTQAEKNGHTQVAAILRAEA